MALNILELFKIGIGPSSGFVVAAEELPDWVNLYAPAVNVIEC